MDKQQSTKHTYKTKDRVTRTPLKTEDELSCSGRVSSSCSTSDVRRFSYYIFIWEYKCTIQTCCDNLKKKCIKFIDSTKYIDNFLLSEWRPFWVILPFINQSMPKQELVILREYMGTPWLFGCVHVTHLVLFSALCFFMFLFVTVLCLVCPILPVCLDCSFLVPLRFL